MPTVGTAALYPTQTRQCTDDLITNANSYATVAYNFCIGGELLHRPARVYVCGVVACCITLHVCGVVGATLYVCVW